MKVATKSQKSAKILERPSRLWNNRQLVKHLRLTGDERAFEILAERFEPLFSKVACLYYLGPSRLDSNEDLKQAMRIKFLLACRGAKAKNFRQNFFAYVRLIAKRGAIGSVRAYNAGKNKYLSQAVSLDSNEKAAQSSNDDGIDPLLGSLETRNPNDLPELAAEINSKVEQIYHAIERDLTTKEKAAVYGFLMGYSHEETGELFGYTAKQMENALERARKRLAKSLAHLI